MLGDDKSAPQRNDIPRTCVHVGIERNDGFWKAFSQAREMHKVHLTHRAGSQVHFGLGPQARLTEMNRPWDLSNVKGKQM